MVQALWTAACPWCIALAASEAVRHRVEPGITPTLRLQAWPRMQIWVR
jgi:hypothetical protein